jgi:hypothetical protein
MESTPVLLADMPPMLEDIVTSVLERCGRIRVERAAGQGDLLRAAGAAGAKIAIVVCDRPGDLASIDARLASAAGAVVLALARDGGSACLHVFASAAEPLQELSPDTMLAALTAVLPPGGEA